MTDTLIEREQPSMHVSKVTASYTETIPTVQYGNVRLSFSAEITMQPDADLRTAQELAQAIARDAVAAEYARYKRASQAGAAYISERFGGKPIE